MNRNEIIKNMLLIKTPGLPLRSARGRDERKQWILLLMEAVGGKIIPGPRLADSISGMFGKECGLVTGTTAEMLRQLEEDGLLVRKISGRRTQYIALPGCQNEEGVPMPSVISAWRESRRIKTPQPALALDNTPSVTVPVPADNDRLAREVLNEAVKAIQERDDLEADLQELAERYIGVVHELGEVRDQLEELKAQQTPLTSRLSEETNRVLNNLRRSLADKL